MPRLSTVRYSSHL